MDIDRLCYDVIGAAMRVHSFFGDGYRRFCETIKSNSGNPVNLVNPVKD